MKSGTGAGVGDGELVNPVYLEDVSGLRGHAERVIVAANEAEVVDALRAANDAAIPVTIAGAGTGVTGARVPFGGWVISLERLNRLEVSEGRATVGAGTLLREVHAAAQGSGQFYPPDPTETAAAIGGNIGTNASGSRSYKYGATRRWVERLRVVLADGRVMDVARGEAIDFEPARIPLPNVTKNTAGYLLRPGMDWVDLMVGSEGTLGVVTEATVRLLPMPRAVLSGVVFFGGDEAALDAVEAWRGAAPARMFEYMDRASLDLLRTKAPEIPREAWAAILIEQELESEDDPEVDRWLERIEAAGALAEESWFGFSAADRERFRMFRHTLPELVNDTVRRGGVMKMNTDYAVPLERNGEMLAYYRQRLEEEFPGRYVLFGHIGDAHVHANLFSSPEDPRH
ncbi:MAG TPA: FAD-binding oxidoreductase, partial [Candidatus Sulfopaludibacter sp.]|nr:FAD-binding oxidoreductase [Candidatus Sulfopaludibacter sp.]